MSRKTRFLAGSSTSLLASLPPTPKPIPEGMVTTRAVQAEPLGIVLETPTCVQPVRKP